MCIRDRVCTKVYFVFAVPKRSKAKVAALKEVSLKSVGRSILVMCQWFRAWSEFGKKKTPRIGS